MKLALEQEIILRSLSEDKPRYVKDIAQDSGLSVAPRSRSQIVLQVLLNLERGGLVCRHPGETPPRWWLTPEGASVVRGLAKASAEPEVDF